MWQLPITAMLGLAGISAFAFSQGVFLGEITKEFGWTRAEFSSAYTLQTIAGIFSAPIVGRLVDRFGSRRILSFSVLPTLLLIGILGAVSGSVRQWQMLAFAQGLVGAFAAPAVWMAVVVRRFDASRGLAVSVTLGGLGLASMLWPLLSMVYVQALGWRLALPAIALTVGVIILPLIYLYIPRSTAPAVKPQRSSAEFKTVVLPLLMSRTFICVTLAGGLFATITLGLSFHMVPLMREKGFSLAAAASLASATGLASFLGRLGTGFLLDRVSTKLVGCIAFLVPVAVALMLMNAGSSLTICLAAVILFGFASGAETDVITYIIARTMPGVFGTVYAIILALLSVSASMGPLIASRLYDVSGSYTLYLWAIIPIVTTGAVLIALLPPVPRPARVIRA